MPHCPIRRRRNQHTSPATSNRLGFTEGESNPTPSARQRRDLRWSRASGVWVNRSYLPTPYGSSSPVRRSTRRAAGSSRAPIHWPTTARPPRWPWRMSSTCFPTGGATVRFLLDAPGLSDDELADLFPATGPHVALTASEPKSAIARGRRAGACGSSSSATPLPARRPQVPASLATDRGVAAAMDQEGAAASHSQGDLNSQETNSRRVRSSGRRVRDGHRDTKTRREARPQAARADRFPRARRRDKVKNLAGFQKTFKLPESATPSAQKWTYRLAADDLHREVEETSNALREHLGLGEQGPGIEQSGPTASVSSARRRSTSRSASASTRTNRPA